LRAAWDGQVILLFFRDCPGGLFFFDRHKKIIGFFCKKKYLNSLFRENEIPFDTSVACGAALGGHLSLLQWLFSMGAPIEKKICEWAARSGNQEMVTWLQARGYNIQNSGNIISMVVSEGHIDMLERMLRYEGEEGGWRER
jgi:hypothetical protein